MSNRPRTFESDPFPSGLVDAALRTRRTFTNWLTVTALAGVGLPSRIPPRRGWRRLMGRRLVFRTRLGPVLETEIGNAAPIVEIFRDGCYALPIDWSSLRLIVDVGGHVGGFSCWAAWRGPQAKLIVFEPEPRNFRDLKANIERNGLAGRTVLVNAGVASSDGVRQLAVPIFRNESSLLSTDALGAVTVDCVSLNRYLCYDCPGTVDLLKFDAEGAEWEVFPSLSPEAWQRVKQVVAECHTSDGRELNALTELLTDAGFTVRARITRTSNPDLWGLVTLWATKPKLQQVRA
jgi:FkbM family methyltransferase